MNEYFLKIKSEFISRITNKNDVYNVIGVEIKDRRLKSSYTLSTLSDNICSISYLCKIENNKIIPNRLFLKEICKKLEMPEDKISSLLQLKPILDNVIKYFFEENDKKVEESYLECVGLSNYRFKIIELIYLLSKKDLYNVNILASELIKLTSTMSDYDLLVFSLFFGIISFYNQNFDDAMDFLSIIRYSKKQDKILHLLYTKYYFYTLYMLDDQGLSYAYNDIKMVLIDNGYLEQLDRIYYIYGMYLLRSRQFYEYKNIYRVIKKKSYKRSLSLMAKLMFNKFLKLDVSYINEAEPFFYYLLGIYNNNSKIVEEVNQLNDLSFDVDFNLLYLKYLLINDDKDRLIFIHDIVIPSINNSSDGFAKKYFINELALICSRTTKYKFFNETFLKFFGINR